jgi:hypothetical protein
MTTMPPTKPSAKQSYVGKPSARIAIVSLPTAPRTAGDQEKQWITQSLFREEAQLLGRGVMEPAYKSTEG